MGIMVIFLAAVAAIAAWWLAHERITAKPWLEYGPTGHGPGPGVPARPAATVGLGLLIVVIAGLFALLISAYSMRMELADWRPLPAPGLLWVNTGLLAMSSIALEWARAAARGGPRDMLRAGLIAAAVASLAFLAGQLIAWRQLTEAGYLLASNPANTFFYLLTGLHGLHVLGGLVALGRTSLKAWGKSPSDKLRLSVGLCAAYWHFLLLIWLVLLNLFMFAPFWSWFYSICFGA